MIDLDAIFAEPKVPIIVIAQPAREKTNALATTTNTTTGRDESEVAEAYPAANAMLEPECVELGADGWPVDTIDPFSVEPCGKCGSLELWENVVGGLRCMRCDPPVISRRLVEDCLRLRSAGRNKQRPSPDHARQCALHPDNQYQGERQ